MYPSLHVEHEFEEHSPQSSIDQSVHVLDIVKGSYEEYLPDPHIHSVFAQFKVQPAPSLQAK